MYLSRFDDPIEVVQDLSFRAKFLAHETSHCSVKIEEIDECIWESLDEMFEASHPTDGEILKHDGYH